MELTRRKAIMGGIVIASLILAALVHWCMLIVGAVVLGLYRLGAGPEV